MGTFLFLLYIKDITNGISNNIRLFADDTSLFIIIDNDIRIQTLSLTEDIHVIKNWSYTWVVDLNANKTVTVNFTRKNIIFPKIQFGYCGEVINQQNSHIHLALHFQSDGSWFKHISSIYEKTCKRLHTLDRRTLIKICFALIRPVFEYGDVDVVG